MYKFSVLLLASLSSLYANTESYLLSQEENETPEYFIQIGAFKSLSNAQNMSDKATINTDVIQLQKYYSVLSQGVKSRDLSVAKLREIRKVYRDAYMITLYKADKQEIETAKDAVADTYNQAIAWYQSARYEEALAAFDRVLIEDEEHVGAGFYYAKTLYRLGLFDESAKFFKALEKKSLTKKQAFERQTYLKALKAKEKTHKFNVTLSVGMGYDDNINLTTDDSLTQYGPITLNNDTTKSDSLFGLASFNLSHRYQTKEFAIVSRLYSYNEFLHSQEGNDLNFIDFSTGIVKKYKAFSFFMPVGFNSSYLEGEEIGYNLYTNPAISYQVNKHFKTYIETNFLKNTTTYTDHRDYRMYGVGMGANYKYKKFTTGAKVAVQNYDAKEDVRFDVDKDVLSMALFSRYFLNSTRYISANLVLSHSNYNLLDSVMGYKREDDHTRAGLSWSEGIGKKSQLNMSYQFRHNESNINAYSYDKNAFSVEYKYKF